MALLQSGNTLTIVALGMLILAFVVVWSAIEMINAHQKGVLTVRGEYRKLLEPGVNFVVPFLSEVYHIDTRTQRAEISIDTTTPDRNRVAAQAHVDLAVADAETAFLAVEDYAEAVTQRAEATLRGVLDDADTETLRGDPAALNERVRSALDDEVDQWGIDIEAVEMTNITVEENDW